jgi:vacuolar protein sorting-associated protein 13A/C
MLEGPIAALLAKFIGKYVKDFDQQNLQMGFWSGDVVLRDVELNIQAISELGLPIRILAGCVRKLTIRIPWKSLTTEATQVC